MAKSNKYTQRVRESILPLSNSDSLPAAFKEWRFTGHCEDHEDTTETCELCHQERLRYHFEIQNDQTKRTLNVGSRCILRFDVAVYENDHKLSSKDAKKKLDDLTAKMRLASCLRALEQVAAKEDNRILNTALAYYRAKGKLSPKLAFVVFWRLDENKIDHAPSFFKISLKRKKHQEDLANMRTSHVHRFWGALTSSQRELAKRLGHSAPQESPRSR
jgi:hypothetical protein